MAEESETTRRVGLIAYAALTVAVIAGLVFAASQLPGSAETATAAPGNTPVPTDVATPQKDDMDKPNSLPGQVLPEAKSGQDAIDSLGEDMVTVAKLNNMTVDRLTDLLLRDETAHVSRSGYLLYIDTNQQRD